MEDIKEMDKSDYKELLNVKKKYNLTEDDIDGFFDFYKLKKPKINILNGENK